MDKPTPKDRVVHVLNAISSIHEFMGDTSQENFLLDSKLQSAVQYQFLIIGEATRHIGENILTKYTYPWHIPKSFRNFIIHEYHGIRMERVYLAKQDLEPLRFVLSSILENEFTK